MSADGHDRLVRPYMITGGRTKTADNLPLEALIEANAAAGERATTLRFEPRRTFELCRRPLSVAEAAAHLGLPLGVMKVVVADLADDDLLTIHITATDDGPDIPLLERLLDGLNAG